jgi:hypothetical protein
MKTKTFDCVAMKRQGAARVYATTKRMSVKEELAYWRKQTTALKLRQRNSRPARRNTTP